MTNLPYPAPIVQLPRDGGGELALSELQRSSVVLFFYPRDNTSGCSKEAQAFTAHQDAFEKLNVKIIGISKDSVKSHDKFVEKQGLGMMVINLVVAGLAGTGIPVLLARVGIDPALASGAFVTTVTDIVGLLAFLGLAGWILL